MNIDISLRLLIFTVTDLQKWYVDNSAMPYWRFYWNNINGAEVKYKGVETSIDPDKFYLIPPGTNFRGKLKNPLKHLNCNFVLSANAGIVDPGVYIIDAPENLLQIVRGKLFVPITSGAKDSAGLALHMRCLVSYCLSELAEFFNPRREYSHKIERILEYINRTVETASGDDLSNPALAQRCEMHCNSFTRIFRKETGTSPQAFVLNKRVAQACLLLHDPKNKIEDIAASLGFYDRYHFSREFKRSLSVPPVKFRENLAI